MIKDLANAELEIKYNAPLSDYTFTKTGGPADILAFPKTEEAIKKLVVYAKQNDLPLTIIGNASNLIVQDGGIRGLTIITTEMKTIEATGDQIIAQAGASIIDTSNMALAASLTGLEFAAGIPGSVGGAVFMNAGAYGGEVKDVITAYRYLDENGNLVTLTGQDMGFAYRHSAIQETGGTIISARFTLKPGDFMAIRDKMTELNERRASKQPLEYPSCGSVFKRPEGHFVGPLIQQAGLQGKIIGGAQVSTKHAGFIVNIGHATATDYIDMIHLIQQTVWDKDQVKLETEVRIIGETK